MSSGFLGSGLERQYILGIITLLVVSLFFSVLSLKVDVSLAESFQIGVKPGDWIEYDLNWTDPPGSPYSVWIRDEVLDVNGSIITIERLQKMDDGSLKNRTETGDIVEGTGAAAAVFIPAGLRPGDLVSIEGFGLVSINGTEQRTYLGREHTVLWSDFLSKGFDLLIYWDRDKGVALEMHTQHITRNGVTKIADSNMWDSGSVDGGDDDYFLWLGILMPIILIIVIALFLVRRNMSSKRKKKRPRS
jgi:hypothetical protein